MHYSAKRSLAIACRLSVCLSVTLLDHGYISWKSWKLIARTISPTSSLFVAKRSSTYSQVNMEKLWGENVCSTPTRITSGWIESTESHVISGVAVCLFTFVGASRGHLCDSTAFLCNKVNTTYTFSEATVLLRGFVNIARQPASDCVNVVLNCNASPSKICTDVYPPGAPWW